MAEAKNLDTGEGEPAPLSPSGESSLGQTGSPSPPPRKLTYSERKGRPKDKGYRHLSKESLETACLLAARGVDLETIAAVVQEPPKRVDRDLRSRASRARLAQLRGELVLHEVQHHHDLIRMLPVARKTIKEGMTHAENTKEAAKVGRWVHEAIVPKPTVRTQVQVEGRIEHDLSPIFDKISEGLAALREARRGHDPLARVQSGAQAMERPLLVERQDSKDAKE